MTINSLQLKKILEVSEKEFSAFGMNPIDAILYPFSKGFSSDKESFEKSLLERIRRIKFLLIRLLFKTNKKTILPIGNYKRVFFISEPTHFKQIKGICLILNKSVNEILIVSNKLNLINLAEEVGLKVYYLSKSRFILKPSLFQQLKKKFWKTLDILKIEAIYFQQPLNLLQQAEIAVSKFLLFEELLKQVKPSLVFIGNDLTPEGRIFALCCKKLDVQTISIQHGLIPEDPMHGFHKVNKVCVFGELSKKALIKEGIDPSRILVTGSPYLDYELFPKDNLHLKKLSDFLSLDISKKNILIAFSGPGHRTSLLHHILMIKLVAKAAFLCHDCNFIFKLHRKDKVMFYAENCNLKDLTNIKLVDDIPKEISNNIFDWLKLSDFLVTSNSASAAEAILLKKPVITLDLLNEYKGVDFIDKGATIHCNTEEQFLQNILALTKDQYGLEQVHQNGLTFIEDYFHKPDGLVSDRIAEMILNSKSQIYQD